MTRTVSLTAAVAALSLSALSLSAETLKVDPAKSKIEFAGTKKDGKHTGGFKTFTGTAEVDSSDPTKTKIALDIDVESTFSDDPKLTKHLLSPDFFEVKKFPKASFVSKGLEKADGGHVLTGDLTFHGVTKTVKFPVKVESAGESLSLTGEYKMDRTEFGITYGEGKIDPAVPVTFSVVFAKK